MELSGGALRNAEAPNHAPSGLLLQVSNLVVRTFPDAAHLDATHDDASHEIRPLNGVTFQIQPGETVGLLGESGAGKTTLANALMRFLPSSSRVAARLYLMDTDNYGRDVFSRLLYGGQISLFGGLLATALSLTLGVILGTVAGFYGGWNDAVIMRGAELFLARSCRCTPARNRLSSC